MRRPHDPDAKRCACLPCRVARLERAMGPLPPLTREDLEVDEVPWEELAPEDARPMSFAPALEERAARLRTMLR